MKIIVKHKSTEVEVDDNSNDTNIRYSFEAIIKVLEKISAEVQSIEKNYNETLSA